jgi:thiol-disulfide isomerase/thioredoxin|tara:strand:+ start:2013 stop:2909 length:897 start_codon:yes stop_codon:yes gene_type:complete
MKRMMKSIVQCSLIAAFILPLPTLAADNKKTRTFNAAAGELIEKVRKLIAEDRAKGFSEYANGARALAKEFSNDARPFIMMSEASGLVNNKQEAVLLKKQAKDGILTILKRDKKNETANSALMRLADSAEPAQAKAYLKQVIENTKGRLAEAAKGKLKNMEALGQPVKITFEAVDGRKVNVAKLKGKVVLIDFWATWCGPCVAELPNVKKTYTKYHKKGFEIVGISLDSNKDKLMNFVEDNNMTWPQQFDGKGWKNRYAVEFGIQSIPAMWLIDKKGNLVDMKARAGLETKVERLLEE